MMSALWFFIGMLTGAVALAIAALAIKRHDDEERYRLWREARDRRVAEIQAILDHVERN